MSTSTIRVRRLQESSQSIVDDLNALLRKLHGKSQRLTIIDLVDHINRSLLFVAEDEGRIIGMVMFVFLPLASNTCGRIHNLVVAKGYGQDVEAQLLEALTKYTLTLPKVRYVDREVDLFDEARIASLRHLGYELREHVATMRLKFS